jgi:hypothetical protein
MSVLVTSVQLMSRIAATLSDAADKFSWQLPLKEPDRTVNPARHHLSGTML